MCVCVCLQADEAYCIGPPPSSESYLRQNKIIEVAKNSGAQVDNLIMFGTAPKSDCHYNIYVRDLALQNTAPLNVHTILYMYLCIPGYPSRVWVSLGKQEFC